MSQILSVPWFYTLFVKSQPDNHKNNASKISNRILCQFYVVRTKMQNQKFILYHIKWCGKFKFVMYLTCFLALLFVSSTGIKVEKCNIKAYTFPSPLNNLQHIFFHDFMFILFSYNLKYPSITYNTFMFSLFSYTPNIPVLHIIHLCSPSLVFTYTVYTAGDFAAFLWTLFSPTACR
jgi:hypothetical protein